MMKLVVLVTALCMATAYGAPQKCGCEASLLGLGQRVEFLENKLREVIANGERFSK